jgi:hypothetical protein
MLEDMSATDEISLVCGISLGIIGSNERDVVRGERRGPLRFMAGIKSDPLAVSHLTELSQKLPVAATDLYNGLAVQLIPLNKVLGQCMSVLLKSKGKMEGVFINSGIIYKLWIKFEVVHMAAPLAKTEFHVPPWNPQCLCLGIQEKIDVNRYLLYFQEDQDILSIADRATARI